MKKLLLCLLLLALNTFGFADERPNIIPMMADDLGYETVSANGGAPYKTPVLDKLAAEGLRWTINRGQGIQSSPVGLCRLLRKEPRGYVTLCSGQTIQTVRGWILLRLY